METHIGTVSETMEINKQNSADCRWLFSSWVLSRFIISAIDETIERTTRDINRYVSFLDFKGSLEFISSRYQSCPKPALGNLSAFPESPSCTYFTACPTVIYGYTTNSLKPKWCLCYLGIPVVLCAYRLFIKYLFDYGEVSEEFLLGSERYDKRKNFSSFRVWNSRFALHR